MLPRPADSNKKLGENESYLQSLRCLDESVEVKIELSTDKEIQVDPLSEFRAPSIETKMHSFIWILNLPKLTKHNIDEYTKWVDSIVRADLADAVN